MTNNPFKAKPYDKVIWNQKEGYITYLDDTELKIHWDCYGEYTYPIEKLKLFKRVDKNTLKLEN